MSTPDLRLDRTGWTEVVALLTDRAQTLACAESLTGGLLAGAVVGVPGASAVLRGGIVAYATDLKASLLGVDPELLARCGPVDPEVAAQMADGARTRLGATWGVATTGVAGPDPQDGMPVGRVYVAVTGGPTGSTRQVRRLDLSGDRAAIRAASVEAARRLVGECLAAPAP